MTKQAPLRILYAEAAMSYWGQERYVHRLMREMRSKGHMVEAICQPDAQLVEILRRDGFTVYTTSMENPWQFWKNLFKVSRIIKKRKFDVVNTNSRKDTVHIGAAARFAKVPLVVRTRHLARRLHSLIAYNWFPHRVIAASNYVKSLIVAKGMPSEHIGVVNPAVDLQKSLPEQKLKLELGLDQDMMLVGSISALRAEKGIDELIQAMAPIIKSNQKVGLVVIGGGSIQAELEAVAKGLGVKENVYFLGERHDVPELIGDLSIFALPTRTEAAPTVFAEAAAAKLPTVGYNCTGVPEMIREGETGVLVGTQDIEALSKAIERLINNPEKRIKMGEAGYKFAVEEGRFTLKTFQENTESLYRQWLGELKK